MKILITGALLALAPATALAQGSVTISGEIRPGVYGRIVIGQQGPPPVVYAQPLIAVPPPPSVPARPVLYLHVPPGHAKNWRKHCHKYDACGHPVYFAHSAEYGPKKQKKPKKDKD